ncbi:MAG: ELM1/GtrOC1 family putative glycosyltransferase [Methylococcaceae bacterium]
MSGAAQVLVWIVNSHYTGELNARLGLVNRLNLPYDYIPLPEGDDYANKLKQKYDAYNEKPLLLIISGTGEETTAEIADLRPYFNGRLITIYLASILPDDVHPRLKEYDLIVSPQLQGDNIVHIIGVAHKLSHSLLAQAKEQYKKVFTEFNTPIIGVLLGGNTRYCLGFDEHHAQGLARRIACIARQLNGTLIITNSRRTPSSSLNIILANLSDYSCHFFDWQENDSLFYPALLAYSSVLIVTGDSLSMCSEAAFTGKPVLIDLPETATECYHRDIIRKLILYGYAQLLTDSFSYWDYTPLDSMSLVVDAIKKKLAVLVCQNEDFQD